MRILDLYPEYKGTSELDTLRATEYDYLDEQKHIYLDYTGAGLAAKGQCLAHSQRLAHTLLGNPHSVNPTSQAANELLEKTRGRVLDYLSASKDQYVVIFTPNATGAARLIGESYHFSWHNRLLLTSDNHNSINGLRQFARNSSAQVKYIHSRRSDLRIDTTAVTRALTGIHGTLSKASLKVGRSIFPTSSRGLFAFPAQSNFSGVRHPLSWIQLAQEHGYDVLLDAAAYLPTETLDLSQIQPQFVIVSWYKFFGYPTGLGCLVARRDALNRLKRPWLSGGTIQAVSVGVKWHTMTPEATAFEDGTLNFLSIPDIAVSLDWLSTVGISVIKTRVHCLTGYCLERLKQLAHNDGKHMIRIYGPRDLVSRGGTVTFNIVDALGNIVDERLVAKESAAVGISLRTGCFCNPGAGEDAIHLRRRNMIPLLWSRLTTIDGYIETLGLPSAGAIRVSIGLVPTVGDLDLFLDFMRKVQESGGDVGWFSTTRELLRWVMQLIWVSRIHIEAPCDSCRGTRE